jgi:hypothetical protein
LAFIVAPNKPPNNPPNSETKKRFDHMTRYVILVR